ncbi:fibronectin type III domain-containing protein [Povalibacter sp.]|uniref:fibronectin type III domain-containing protein n=1 Tax=Povalibacter sp. TaxID=1962978 RepID=UPI002F3EB4E1
MFIAQSKFRRDVQHFILILLTTLCVPQFASAAVNKPPVIKGTPATTATVGTAYSFTAKATDPEGKFVSFGIRNKPDWATFDRYAGRLSGTPKKSGTHSNIDIYAWDGVNGVSLPKFKIVVQASGTTNRAPVISGTPATSVTVGGSYSFKPTASDPDGNSLGFTIANRPSWATFSTSTGQLTGKPASSNVGTFSNIVISVSDGKISKSLSAFSIAVKASGSTNTAPTISGSPITAINAGSAYSFTPKASDANGDTLKFSVQNKPSWATFSTTNGRLSGTPSASQVGSYSNIVITVTDGKASTALKAFAIKVTAVSNGSASLSWTPPTRNTDGSALSNLSGYRIYYGTSSSAMNKTVQLNNPSLSSYVVDNLSPATYYFAVKALTSNGKESAMSNTASKKVN